MQYISRIIRLLFKGEWDVNMEGFTFIRKHLSIKARFNIIWQRISHLLRPVSCLGIPYYICVEPASICNLQCPICPSGLNKSRRDPALLPLQDFKNMIDDIGDYLVCIQLWEWGEPFLNLDIYEMIAYAKTKGIIVVTSTNGHFFNSADKVEKLLASGLDGVVLAVDGTTQEVYEKYRAGGNLEKVLEGIRRIVQAKKDHQATSPVLHFRMVINAFNEHQVDDFVQLGKDLGVDLLSYKTINCNMGGEERSDFVLPQETGYIRPKQKEGYAYHCTLPWCNPVLFSDGKIGLCGLSSQGETALEKISATRSFHQIWNSAEAKTFRINMKKDCNYYPFCRNCDCREPDYQESRFNIQKLQG